jgi:hypothetical protein
MSDSENRFYCRVCKSWHERDKLVTMPLHHVAKDVNVPLAMIQDMQQSNVLQNPLTCGNVEKLDWFGEVLEAFGGDYKPSNHVRARLDHWSLQKDYQKWIYEHYLYNQSGEKIWVKLVAIEVSAAFGMTNSLALHNEIRVIRVIAYNDRRKARETGKSVEEIARERFAQQELDFEDE